MKNTTSNNSNRELLMISELSSTFFKELAADVVAIRRGTYEHLISNEDQPQETPTTRSHDSPKVKACFTCRSCDAAFGTLEEQREHFKTDWHRHNLKVKLAQGNNAKAVSDAEFQEQQHQPNDSHADGNSSSSSDEEDDGPIWRPEEDVDGEEGEESSPKAKSYGSPKITFERQNGDTLSVFKAILQRDPKDDDYLSGLKAIPERTKWTIMLCSGGHFAGAVFDGAKCLVHKALHRYTTRRKQGGLQCVKDAKGGGHPKSAGSNLRRHNEVKLQEEITELIAAWRVDIETSDFVFLHAPYHTRACFFGGDSAADSVLKVGDPRIRSIPFQTKRPTFAEVTRVWQTFSTIEVTSLSQWSYRHHYTTTSSTHHHKSSSRSQNRSRSPEQQQQQQQ
eukprot:TRINITY_DN14758_c0_g1_i1.p1 TRINITY_DN14758_c0_g1~~TRINITY_DN14758_c0_g1_i1.p1  ORF type:complete len:393 (+),score=93.21 TRINITY_DN14758_c0_g1_i1:49-1227(+)